MRCLATIISISLLMLCGCSVARTRMYNYYNTAERVTGRVATGTAHFVAEGLVNGLSSDDDFFDE
jgi:hypothetical protein